MAEPIDYPRTLFVERQHPRGWPFWLAMLPVAVAGSAVAYFVFFAGGAPPFVRGFALMMVLLVPTLVVLQRLSVTVTSHELTVRYGPFRTVRLNLADIAEAKADTYEPIREFGGWGIKWSLRDSTTGYTMHGNRGVRIVTTAGRKYLIGSQRPDELAAAIRRGGRGATMNGK